MNPFVERHHDEIAGIISCFDRVVITGTLPDIGHAQTTSGYLTDQGRPYASSWRPDDLLGDCIPCFSG